MTGRQPEGRVAQSSHSSMNFHPDFYSQHSVKTVENAMLENELLKVGSVFLSQLHVGDTCLMSAEHCQEEPCQRAR